MTSTTSTKCINRAVLITVAALFFSGCDELATKRFAAGSGSDVVVVADSATWNSAVGDALRFELGRWIETLPAPEPVFNVKHQTISSQRVFDYVTSLKNVVFVAALDDTTTEARFVRSAFSPEAIEAIRTGEGGVVPRDDIWRTSQRVYYIAAENPQQLVETVHQAAPSIRTGFNDIARSRMERDMFRKLRQVDVEQAMLDKHGFRVKVQHDYLVAADTTDLIWMRRILSSESWRNLIIHYTEKGNPAELDPAWIYATRDSLTKEYLKGNVGGYVRIDYRRPLVTRNIDFLGRFGYETRGLWHMVEEGEDGDLDEYGMGGPFLSYSFYDQDTGRIYFVDGMVFAPGYDKREFLRQMEVIAYTFKSAPEMEEETAPS